MSDLIQRLRDLRDERVLTYVDGRWRQADYTQEIMSEAADALERLRAVVDAVDYLKECWLQSPEAKDWGNALPYLFEMRAALETDEDE